MWDKEKHYFEKKNEKKEQNLNMGFNMGFKIIFDIKQCMKKPTIFRPEVRRSNYKSNLTVRKYLSDGNQTFKQRV